jgi:hypothetical protein
MLQQTTQSPALRRLRVKIRVSPVGHSHLHARLQHVPAVERDTALIELSSYGARKLGAANSVSTLLAVGEPINADAAPLEISVNTRLDQANSAELLDCLAGLRQRDTGRRMAALANFAVFVLANQLSEMLTLPASGSVAASKADAGVPLSANSNSTKENDPSRVLPQAMHPKIANVRVDQVEQHAPDATASDKKMRFFSHKNRNTLREQP